jgi:Cd2+/Zn2+-exporting ATPase
MNKKQRNMLARIIIALIMTVALFFIDATGWTRFLLYLIIYLIIGYDILKKAWLGIIHGRVFDENFLMAVATVGAFALALYEESGDYLEAVAVMLFYQIGEFFQSYAVGKSRRDIAALMDIRPDYANIEKDGKIIKVDPDYVEIGQTIIIQPGERIPIDGIIVSGKSSLNTSALTGESLPREVNSGDEVISGSINLSGILKVRTTKDFGIGRRISSTKIEVREFHCQIRPHIYSGCMLRSIGPCSSTTSFSDHIQWCATGLFHF